MKDKDFELEMLNVTKNKLMSTIFGVLKKGLPEIQLENDCLPEGYYDDRDEIFTVIGQRSNRGGFSVDYSIEKIFDYLDDDIKVYALDNSQQGIYTIRDIRKELNK